jgi:hypothetical protein
MYAQITNVTHDDYYVKKYYGIRTYDISKIDPFVKILEILKNIGIFMYLNVYFCKLITNNDDSNQNFNTIQFLQANAENIEEEDNVKMPFIKQLLTKRFNKQEKKVEVKKCVNQLKSSDFKKLINNCECVFSVKNN